MFEDHESIGEHGHKGTLANYEIWVRAFPKSVNSAVRSEVKCRQADESRDESSGHYAKDHPRLRQFLLPMKGEHINVVEVAAGEHFSVVYTLFKNGFDFCYVSFDVFPESQKCYIQGTQEWGIHGQIHHVLATSSSLPLFDDFADVCVYIHAIDDIWYTEGINGVRASLSESLRVLKPDGIIISWDKEIDIDPSTHYISHMDVRKFLDEMCEYEFEEFDNIAPGRGWLLVHNIRPSH